MGVSGWSQTSKKKKIEVKVKEVVLYFVSSHFKRI